ncbi:MAG TPA: D-aminoacyl-tRNA deacylase [Lachnospiraceae bacterium]|nr:D-aminoacyl-tRNA deacylase [Lachnospiraceae bacterium]
MKLLIQRVLEATVTVEDKPIGEIAKGLFILVGITDKDTQITVDKMVTKALNLRIFSDKNDKINLSLLDVKGSLLIVSQFTLYADCHKGNRPSFINAGSPDHALRLYEYMIERCKESVANVQHGSFGADMQVSLINDGPFTISLDSDELIK